ncbi:hypothetical protein PMIN04_004430 [Paraphaeosphaeria minitans]
MVVNAGNSFTGDPVNSIIAGQREKSGAVKGKLIHISGGGNFIDFGTSGNFNPNDKVWNDAKEEHIKAIRKDMFNGQSDVPVLEAGSDIDTYIVCPTLGYVPYVGDGTAVLSTCHVLDLVDFLVKITERAAEGPADGTAYSPYYMLETFSVPWKEMATELAKAMHTRGIFRSPEPKMVPFGKAGEGEVKHLVAANMLMKGDRAVAMGFKPRQPSVLEQIHEDLRVVPI